MQVDDAHKYLRKQAAAKRKYMNGKRCCRSSTGYAALRYQPRNSYGREEKSKIVIQLCN
jgi:hypothetical protein